MLNVVVNFSPTCDMAVMAAIAIKVAIKVAIKPYSMAVATFSAHISLRRILSLDPNKLCAEAISSDRLRQFREECFTKT